MSAPQQLQLQLISSMATRQLLADLVARFERASAHRVRLEAVGGVDAARRVQAGEAFDGVVLAAATIDQLIASGHVLAGSRVNLVTSGVSVAVRSGAARPDIGSESAVREAVLAARSVGYSTGPSGVQLVQLFERWGVAEQIRDHLVQAPPGVPVGQLVAQGQVELGFQQLSELMSLAGIDVIGPLPPAIQITTTFSAGVASASKQPDAVRELLAFMSAPAVDAIKRDNGMQPA